MFASSVRRGLIASTPVSIISVKRKCKEENKIVRFLLPRIDLARDSGITRPDCSESSAARRTLHAAPSSPGPAPRDPVRDQLDVAPVLDVSARAYVGRGTVRDRVRRGGGAPGPARRPPPS